MTLVLDSVQIVLGPLREDDVPVLFRWINDRALVIHSAPFRPVSWNEHVAWFADIQSRADTRIFGIRLKESGALVGSCQLHSIDTAKETAELQIRIGETSAQGRGLGTEAVRQLLDIAFSELGLRAVTLQVFARNARAIRVYEKAGFKREHVLPGAATVEGERLDVVVMAVSRDGRRA